MPASHATAVGDQEPLLYGAGLDAVKSVVVDASSVTADASNDYRRILLPGTLLKKSSGVGPGSPAKDQYVKYNGSGLIEGVLKTRVELIDGLSNSDIPAAMYFHGCVFDARKIVDYSTYGAVAASTMASRGTGCTFEVPTS